MQSLDRVSTGLKGLDEIVDNLRVGDNVVWRVDDIEEYAYFVQSYVNRALKDNRRVVYMRFAQHKPLVKQHANIRVYNLDAGSGFESFSTDVHTIITNEGKGVFYVFDCLSDLLSAWSTDLMIGNFFMITCPYLFELDTIAYFAIIRASHSYKTVARIRETTQVLIDTYKAGGLFCVHPLKVWQRYSPTMFLPHLQEGGQFIPIANSIDAAKLFHDVSRQTMERAHRKLDYWDRLFLHAQELLDKPWESGAKEDMIDRICRIMITREPRLSILVKENFTLEDLLQIRERLIGTGFIGGKAAGMLLARKILTEDRSFDWDKVLEPHDSFYVGSDVFYTYIVQNGWWKLRMEQKTKDGYFWAGKIMKEKMKNGTFPPEIREQFFEIVEYFGSSPFLVRSSSLLEDAFGNAFAGKYDSIFCVNQGSPEERYAQFESAVRRIYASTMNEDALMYRLQRGLENEDEQMALLVQRVSGSYRKHFAFPDIGGVGISYNTFVWKPDMDPKAGMLRLVFGLGTRAVNRTEGDYPRIVALDAPLVKPHGGMEDTRKFSQRDVDVLNLKDNKLQTIPLIKLMGQKLDINLEKIAVRDHETNEKLKQLGIKDQDAWIITFDELLSQTSFTKIMQKMLGKLETIYQYPVDIEFTVNFRKNGTFQINLVQCRPLQTMGGETRVEFPDNVKSDAIFFRSEGKFMGGSIFQTIKRIIYVDPKGYNNLALTGKYNVARLIGKLNRKIESREECPTMLLGPGRWGSSTPSLGVPVSFSEINNMNVLGEIAYVDANLIPELSYGTHFFQDLVETKIFYVALFPGDDNVIFDEHYVKALPNHLDEIVPDAHSYRDIVKVYDVEKTTIQIVADVVSQQVMCYHE
jgi:hypothetical protein